MSTLSVRIVNVDYYLSPPIRGLDVTYSHFRGAPVRLVPVIRVFGITRSGTKSCIHIHGVLPYIYLPYDGTGNADSLMYQIANGLDDVISKESGYSSRHHIFKMVLVNGIPFYGYHSKNHQYFKIYFYNPSVIKKAVNCFQNGSINNTKFQPYEAHIPFVLQFFIDYNLYGMSFMHLAKWTQRSSPSEKDSQSSLSQNNTKVTYCELEGDAMADDIKNKTDISGNINPGLANIWAEELERRKSEGKPMMSLLSESQERTDITPNDFELQLKEQLLTYLEQRMSSETLDDKEETNVQIETSEHSTLPTAFAETSHVDLNCEDKEIDDLNLTPDDSVFLNSQDMSLVFAIEKLMTGGNEIEAENADCDSILGSQMEPDEELDEETDRVDLSQPLELINDSQEDYETDRCLGASETLQANHNNDLVNDWDDKYWSGVENISQISLKVKQDSNSKPMYVDGNMDDDSPDRTIIYDKTPEKRTSASGSVTPKRRYQPLKISIQKSPNRLPNLLQKKVGGSNQNSGDIDLLKQFQLSAAKIDEQIRSPNKSPLIKQIIPQCVKSPSREKTEKVRKKLTSEMKAVAGKKNKITGKAYKSLRIHLLKRSKSNEDQGLTSLELNPETLGEQSKLSEKNSLDVTDVDKHIQPVKSEKAKKSLFQKVGSPPESPLLNPSPSRSTVNDPGPYNERLSFDKSLDASSLEVSTDLGIISFYDTTNYNLKPDNLFPASTSKKYIYEPLHLPPSCEDVVSSLNSYGLSKHRKIEPFYSNPKDDPLTGKEIGLDLIKVATYYPASLGEFIGSFGNPLSEFHSALCNELLSTGSRSERVKRPFSILASQREVVLMPVKIPPTFKEAKDWIKNKNLDLVPKSEKGKKKKIYIQQSPSCFETESVILTPTQSENLSQLSVICSTPDLCSQSPENMMLQNPSMSGGPVPEVNEINLGSTSSLGSSKLSTVVNKDELMPELNVRSNSCALECVTPDNSGAFKMDLENLQDAHAVCEYKYITLLELEIHVQTRGELKPDPEYDPISAIFYSILNDVPPDWNKPHQVTGVIIFSEDGRSSTLGGDYLIETTLSEVELINALVNIVRKWDPDILIGYEIEMLSWGYLIERGYKLGINLINELSRVITTFTPHIDSEAPFRYYDLKLNGRIILNIWRLMRHEVALMSYSFENVIYHILHTRVPTFSFKTLSLWWNNKLQHYRELTVKHYLIRVLGVIQLLEQLDLVGRTSELASLFGIQFYEVFSRGSQFRVESMMLRMAKPMNYVAISPSIQQRAVMKAPECLPLIMEPKSRFYGDPVIVLDFQSLYPSMIIAYNYCFSTCLGRIHHLAKSGYFEFGCSELKVPLKDFKAVKDSIHISPVGIAFVKSNVRLGILPRMLEEILNTRLMVKHSLKEHKKNKTLRRVLDARQLGLKLIANVTYGYTSANFSGRMACVEIADSVVSKGRETLENAINLVNKTKKWGAKVVYGDTDSLFVLCPGKTRKEAFLIGQEIADTVTQMNPKPVKLKLEKVYQPCILQTKKRYVGYMYESIDQEKPVYDAKGIETVRRDGCPAVSKILEKSLKILFETCDVSKVKDYVTRQMVKLMSGRLSIQDLTFAREFRGLNGYKPGACVPALKLAKEWLVKDRRAEPRVSERVGYIIACGPPGLPLIKLVRSPIELLTDLSLRVNHEYYITKAILPPLDRCFTLLGVDVFSWYTSVPKKQYIFLHSKDSQKRGTISQYFSTVNCLICNSLCTSGVCEICQRNPQKLSVTLTCKINKWERKHSLITKLCFSCCGGVQGSECTSLDCPVLYQKILAKNDVKQAECVREIQGQYLADQF